MKEKTPTEKDEKSFNFVYNKLKNRNINGKLIITELNLIRFSDRIVIRGDNCWEWVGRRSKNNYGFFSCGINSDFAHRVSWKLFESIKIWSFITNLSELVLSLNFVYVAAIKFHLSLNNSPLL